MALEFGIEAEYRRYHGVHEFELNDGTTVTSLSFPSWEEYIMALSHLPPTEGYIVSPELITSTVDFPEILSMQEQIDDRVEQVRVISENHPKATLILGAATVDGKGTRRNSLIVINSGSIGGSIDKRGIMWPMEGAVFERSLRPQAPLRKVGHAALICGDIQSAAAWGRVQGNPQFKLLEPNSEVVLVGSCWAYPVAEYFPGMRPSGTGVGDGRYKPPLETVIRRLFSAFPLLKDVVMSDRTIPGVSGTPPYNAHFKRIT
jgi:hypothetical protein